MLRRPVRRHRWLSARGKQRGWSLIETMIALAAGVILIGASMQGLVSFHRQFSGQQSAVAQQQEVRLALEVLEQELLLASAESIVSFGVEEVEFGANLHGYATTLSAPAASGQTTISVEEGSGWPGAKTVLLCWFEACERSILARDGQSSMLTLTSPLSRSIPMGASVAVNNRVRYYAKKDERGVLRFMRQVDGGAAVLVGPIKSLRFSYWDDLGRPALLPSKVKRIVVKVEVPNSLIAAGREYTLRG